MRAHSRREECDVSGGNRFLAVVAIASGVSVMSLWAQGAPPPAAVFTLSQAETGKAAYQAHCASCHAADLGGQNEFPQLAGPDFLTSWKGRTTQELLEFISTTMPPEGPALTPKEYLDITAHVLRENGAAPGTEALTAKTAVPIGTVAPGKRPGGHVADRRSRSDPFPGSPRW